MNSNIHAQQIPADVLAAVKKNLEDSISKLNPYLVALTEHDRMTLLKMGQKSLSFVTKAQEYAIQNPTLLPAFVNKADFDIDVADAVNLTGLKAQVDQLASLVDDTIMVAGSEAFTAALGFYNNAKLASKQNVPGAKVIFDELSTRFSARTKKVQSA